MSVWLMFKSVLRRHYSKGAYTSLSLRLSGLECSVMQHVCCMLYSTYEHEMLAQLAVHMHMVL